MTTLVPQGSKALAFSFYDLTKALTGGAIGLVGVLATQLIAWMAGSDFQTLFGDWAPLVAAVGMAAVNMFVEISKNGLDSYEAWKNAGWGAAIAGVTAGYFYLDALAKSGEISKNPYQLLVYAIMVNLLKRYALATGTAIKKVEAA